MKQRFWPALLVSCGSLITGISGSHAASPSGQVLPAPIAVAQPQAPSGPAARAGHALPPIGSSSCKAPSAAAKPKVYWLAMDCFFNAKDFVAAATAGEALIKKDPTALKAYTLVSWFHWNQSQIEVGDKETASAKEALEWLNRAVEKFPLSWQAIEERGDFFYLRSKEIDHAYADYMKARELADIPIDQSPGTDVATPGRRAGIENRIARVTEKLDRKGESVEASCRALYYDPDDKSAADRIKRLKGSCLRKKVADPRLPSKKSEGEAAKE